MTSVAALRLARTLWRWTPLGIFAVLLVTFGSRSPRFLTFANLSAVLVQSSWLVVVALGMNFALLGAGVDLSVGAVMYLAAVTVGLALAKQPVWICLMASLAVGASCGAINGFLILRLGILPFIVTLATTFVGRGVALFLSSTKIVYANAAVAHLGGARVLAIPALLWLSGGATAIAWVILNRTPLGPYVRSIGSDAEAARRAGVPTVTVWSVYTLCGVFAGLGGFVSLSQTAAASGSFGQGSEFLAIAAAVLGGTSLFGGRGHVWAPVIGAILIMTVQNGLVMINANPYAYPVITGTVIFIAALLDAIRSRLQTRWERRAVWV